MNLILKVVEVVVFVLSQLWSAVLFMCMFMLKFDCTNTLNDQILENVTVQMETADGFEVIKYIPCPSLPYDKPGACYTVCSLPEDPVSGEYILQ